MIRALLAGLVLVAGGCDKRSDPAPAPPPGSGSPADLPDPLRLDWQSLRYDLGSLGSVKADGALTQFKVYEDEAGAVHATQDPRLEGIGKGFLDLDPPVLVDVDADHHDESVIPFELKSGKDSVYGVFVFTLRDGLPVQLGAITTPSRHGFTIEGATIKTAAGAVWGWDPAQKRLIER